MGVLITDKSREPGGDGAMCASPHGSASHFFDTARNGLERIDRLSLRNCVLASHPDADRAFEPRIELSALKVP